MSFQGLDWIFRSIGRKKRSRAEFGFESVLATIGKSGDRAALMTKGFCYFLGTVAESGNLEISKGFHDLFLIMGEQVRWDIQFQ